MSNYNSIMSILLIMPLQAFHFVDFDTAMHRKAYANVCLRDPNASLYTFFKKLYLQGQQVPLNPRMLRISRITHHICLGRGRQWPPEYEQYLQSWLQLLPTWDHMLWFDEEVVSLIRLYPAWYKRYEAETNWAARADIARYLILWVYGGLYVDWDQECLQATGFDDLHHQFDLYAGIQPLDTNRVQLGIGIIGAAAGHPLLQHLLDEIDPSIKPIIMRTGPLYFTRLFCYYVPQWCNLHAIALPASYFYPCGYEQKGQSANMWQQPESMAVHHWAGSWLKKE